MDGNTSRLWHRWLSLYIAAALGLRERKAQNACKQSEQNASAKCEAEGAKRPSYAAEQAQREELLVGMILQSTT